MKNIYFALCILFITSNCTWSQSIKEPAKTPAFRYADDFLIGNNTQRAKVLLLGVWHFDYPNCDAHRIDSSNMIDVLTPGRQIEMNEVIDLLKKFQPTKICIESQYRRKIDSLYDAYLAGDYKLTRSEVDQLGFRLAMQLGHKNIYPVDASNYAAENKDTYPEIRKNFAVDASNFDVDCEAKYPEMEKVSSLEVITNPLNTAHWDTSFAMWYSYQDRLLSHCTILEKLTYLNDPRNTLRTFGNYVVGSFNTKDNSGPDELALWWYDRNLRIFNNILNTKPVPEDRILVIIGSGHQPILQQCFEASPQFELVPFSDLFKLQD